MTAIIIVIVGKNYQVIYILAILFILNGAHFDRLERMSALKCSYHIFQQRNEYIQWHLPRSPNIRATASRIRSIIFIITLLPFLKCPCVEFLLHIRHRAIPPSRCSHVQAKLVLNSKVVITVTLLTCE